MKTTIVSLVLGFLLFNNVWAEHEADHRYNIRGYVLDDRKQGIGNLPVQAYSKDKLLGSDKTNSDGYYSLHLHLHNSDYGNLIRLRAGPHQTDLRVTFDPADRSTARIHEINFINGEPVEDKLDHFRVPSWVYMVGGFFSLIVILIYLESRRKKKIRQAKRKSTGKQTSSRHRAKKKHRKKH